MSLPVTAYLLLGSNLGDRAALLQQARTQLAATAGEIVATSGLYETAAWGRADQPAFLNQALGVRTTHPAAALLELCLAAERQAGRERLERWGSRTLDVDILLYGQKIIAEPGLTVPHPHLPARRFALVPLAEIAAQAVHPGLGCRVATLLTQCPDPLPVRPWPA
jgi:2-amino-4-hydroxy-6-hydroxymethyldihydropteridine diphosphokinase